MNQPTQPDQPQAAPTDQELRTEQPARVTLAADAANPSNAMEVRVSAQTGQTLMSQWWLLTLRGVIAILFGALTLLMPGVTLLTLAALFAAFALVGGAVWTFGALRHRQGDERWWLMLLLGVVSLAAGATAMLHPAMTTVVLIMLVGPMRW